MVKKITKKYTAEQKERMSNLTNSYYMTVKDIHDDIQSMRCRISEIELHLGMLREQVNKLYSNFKDDLDEDQEENLIGRQISTMVNGMIGTLQVIVPLIEQSGATVHNKKLNEFEKEMEGIINE